MAELFKTGVWDGEHKLAIRICAGGIPSNSLSLARLLQAKGFIIDKDTVSAWSIETTVDDNGDTLFIGPDFEGQSLDEVCSNNKRKGFYALLEVSRAFLVIEKQHSCIPCPPSSGILINREMQEDGGTVLILPSELAQRALHSREQGARSSSAAFLRSPRAEGYAAGAAFLLAQLVYRTASGQSAYSIEQEGQDMAQGSFIPLCERCPELDAGLAQTVDETLHKPQTDDLARLASALQVASSAGWYRKLSPEEESNRTRQLAVSQMKLSNRKRREAFWRSKKNLVAGIGACCALILVFALSLADARRRKPNYSELSPSELVVTYYRAVDALDIDSIEACAEREASKPDLDYVSMITVVTKMRQAYEGKNPIIRAEDWLHSGQPGLSTDQVLYGFTGLSLVEVEKSEKKARFRAEYTSWAVDRGANEGSEAIESQAKDAARIVKGFVIDDLSLEHLGARGWRIKDIDRSVH